FGRSMLVATTYGRGVFAIRLTDTILLANGDPLSKYAVSPVSGPHVAALGPISTSTPMPGILVTFSSPVDPVTFTTADVTSVTGPTGAPIAVSQILDLGGSGHNVYEILFATAQTQLGFYSVTFGPNLSDLFGDKMDQNQNF